MISPNTSITHPSVDELGGVTLEHRTELVRCSSVQCFDQLQGLSRCCNDQLTGIARTAVSEPVGQAGGCEYACARCRRNPLIADEILDLSIQHVERLVVVLVAVRGRA